MSAFISDDFLLHSREAGRLFAEHAAELPIIDFHTHLPPDEIAEDRRWDNIAQVWLGGDHYKWRQMRANGIAERFCTGDASDREKFDAFASVMPYLLRNPLYHWCHLELARYFDIDDLLLSSETAEEVWGRTAEVLSEGLTARTLIARSNVEVLCTTDDPTDSLEHHRVLADDQSFGTRLRPTFRPDRVLAVEDPGAWNEYVDRLAQSADMDITHYDDLIAALAARIEAFAALSCRLSDHALQAAVFEPASGGEIHTLFERLRARSPVDELQADQLRTAILLDLGRLYAERDWTMQLHIGALRNTNVRRFHQLGPDTGFDAMGDRLDVRALTLFLDALDAERKLPRVILYNVNPRDNEMLASLLACFEDGSKVGKLQLGSAWWFMDQLDGMQRQLEAVSQIASLRRFIGMVADSRSFLSFTRHEYFRRILCNLLGADMKAGLIPRDFGLVGELVRDVCYRNAKEYLRL